MSIISNNLELSKKMVSIYFLDGDVHFFLSYVIFIIVLLLHLNIYGEKSKSGQTLAHICWFHLYASYHLNTNLHADHRVIAL